MKAQVPVPPAKPLVSVSSRRDRSPSGSEPPVRTRDAGRDARPLSPSPDRSMRQWRSRRMVPSTPGRVGGVRQTSARGRERRARSRPLRPLRPGHGFAVHAHSRRASVQPTSAEGVRQAKGGRPTGINRRLLPPEREPYHASVEGAPLGASSAPPPFSVVFDTRKHRGRLFDRLDQLDLAPEHVIGVAGRALIIRIQPSEFGIHHQYQLPVMDVAR
jgi:hypothetical protein